MEQKKKKGYGAGIVTGILATVLVSLLLLGGFRVITNTAGSYASGKVTEKEVSKKLISFFDTSFSVTLPDA